MGFLRRLKLTLGDEERRPETTTKELAEFTAAEPQVRAIIAQYGGSAAVEELLQTIRRGVFEMDTAARNHGHRVTQEAAQSWAHLMLGFSYKVFRDYYLQTGMESAGADRLARRHADEIWQGLQTTPDQAVGRDRYLVDPEHIMDRHLVDALFKQTNVGVNDLVSNGSDHRDYWISTMRYSEAGWQTAIFDRNTPSWLQKPLLRVNEMDSASLALFNHMVAIALAARIAPSHWPRGFYWKRPEHPQWAKSFVEVETLLNEQFSSVTQAGDTEIRVLYSELRRRYDTRHL